MSFMVKTIPLPVIPFSPDPLNPDSRYPSPEPTDLCYNPSCHARGVLLQLFLRAERWPSQAEGARLLKRVKELKLFSRVRIPASPPAKQNKDMRP